MTAHTLTPRQYIDARYREVRETYPAIPAHELREDLHEPYLIDDWFQVIFEAAGRGETLRPIVLDRVFELREHSFWLLLKWHPACLPAGYLNPRVRHREKSV